MRQKPVLSIVTPTRGNFSDYWLQQLLRVQGNVEFVLIYPPGTTARSIEDTRVRSIVSPYKGEMMQRLVGLLNAVGNYVLALDDDDFVHSDVTELVTNYFMRFPESWILRLKKTVIDYREEARILKDWDEIPNVTNLEVCRKTAETLNPYQNGQFAGLLEVPIAPLNLAFDIRRVLLPFIERTDNYGYHFENFNNIVWRNDVVQPALSDLTQTTRISGALTWIPVSGFDRLLGLYVQAKHFQPDAIIGHWMPGSEQIRYIDKPATLKPPRFHVVSDALLVKRFPQYGYLWNLFFEKLYAVPRTFGKLMRVKFSKPRLTA